MIRITISSTSTSTSSRPPLPPTTENVNVFIQYGKRCEACEELSFIRLDNTVLLVLLYMVVSRRAAKSSPSPLGGGDLCQFSPANRIRPLSDVCGIIYGKCYD